MRIDSELCGWVLFETQLDRYAKHNHIRLLGRCVLNNIIIDTAFPVLQNGRVHELVKLPDGITGLTLSLPGGETLQDSKFIIRRVARFERVWRMLNRVNGTLRKLSNSQREKVGLSLWKMLFNLPDAYRIATQLRGTIPYSAWVARCDELSEYETQCIRQHVATMLAPPHFCVCLVVDGAAPDALQTTLDSLNEQIYRNFKCTVLGGEDDRCELRNVEQIACFVAQSRMSAWLGQFNDSLADSKVDEWVMMVRAGDVLAPHALYQFACAALGRPEAAVLYSDDDLLDANGHRCAPRFKPDWSLTHLRSTNFIGDAVALRGDEVVKAGGLSMDCCRHGSYDLLLRVIDAAGDEGAESVAHIPALLLHRHAALTHPHPNPPLEGEGIITGAIPPRQRGLEHGDWNAPQWNMEKLREHLARNGLIGDVSETIPGCRRVRYQLPDEPAMVSIIVPTRDAPELIRQCVESLLKKTTYPRFEILVVDNQSADPDALAYLEEIACHKQVRVLRYDQSFNYSAINNFAVREARGEVVCLLNNDTEVISPDWLEEMVGHLLQPKAGVVGAKLYFPDGRVQHAGDTVGPGGCANHLHSFIERNDPGYCNRAMVAQELSAVTAACLITWRELYQRLGGLNEKRLPVAFNDVDYCLRVREAGHRVVWTPHAELYHHESVSRGKDTTRRKKWRASREAAYMRKRWRQVMQNDPFYNPNLSYQRPDFSLSHAPLIAQPWK